MMGVWYETYWAPPHFEKPEEVWFDFVEVWLATNDSDTVAVKAHGRLVESVCQNIDRWTDEIQLERPLSHFPCSIHFQCVMN